MTQDQENRPWALRLRQERSRLGLTQAELAQIGGVSKTSQVAYEAGSTNPDIAYLSRVREAGVNVGWVMSGTSEVGEVEWGLVNEILALIDEWVGERGKPPTASERGDLLRTLYAQFSGGRRIDSEQLNAFFRLVK